ncbi:hypothetical protein SteCoe_36569 [Stentor coeruleus]|uniref:Kelch motif family protein n=1 Tax=Stentor coeruleus TaxID=5963 RepID=A0A1R2APZ4_9CILI|nr:hypothetical protein SteCoe_36569 [Stentor coeruleus]
MDLKCNFKGCPDPPSYWQCLENLNFFCQNHIVQYINDNPRTTHLIQALYAKISPEVKVLNLEKISISIDSLNFCDNSIKTDLESIINYLTLLKEEYINYFKTQRQFFQELTKNIENKNTEITIPGYESQKFSFDSYNSYISKTYQNVKSFCQIINHNLSKLCENIHNPNEFYYIDELNYLENANLDENLYAFQVRTKTLIQLNIQTYNWNAFQVNVNEKQGYNASICQIPGKKLFYSGGCSPNLETAYLIDLQSFSVEQLPKSRIRSYTVATYYDSFVYIFGGYNGNEQLSNSDKFDLENKVWVEIALLPKASHDVHVLPFREYFLMTFCANNSMLKYYINENIYEATGQDPGRYTALIRDIKKIYLISSSVLYLSYEENLNKWEIVKSLNQSFGRHTSKPITRNRDVFMLSSCSNEVWKFNLDNLDLILLGKIW